MSIKSKKATLGVAAMLAGILALPIAALVNWAVGLLMLSLPVVLIYKTKD
jgi:hypothetical protein